MALFRSFTVNPQAEARTLRLASVFLPICLLATTLPVFGAYFASFVLFLSLLILGVLHQPLLVFWSKYQTDEEPAVWLFDRLVIPLHLGILSLLLSHVLATTGAVLTVGPQDFESLRLAFKSTAHMLSKWGLLYLTLVAAARFLVRRGYDFDRLGLWLAGWLALHLVYCLVQRYTGINWSHGINAKLGDHRLAYGVYRVSGFMGHPLTLAYNLVLIALVCMPWAACLRARLDDRWRHWAMAAGLAVLTLGISGSRFPLLACLLAFALSIPWAKPWRVLLGLVGFLGMVAALLWFEGGMLARTGELFDASVPWQQRFDRWRFWQAHWQLFLDYPIFGSGIWQVSDKVKAIYEGMGITDKQYSAHNIWLQFLADSGGVGFLGLLGFFVGTFLTIQRCRAVAGRWNPAMALFVAVVVSGLLQNNLRDSEFVYCLWLVLALAVARCARFAA